LLQLDRTQFSSVKVKKGPSDKSALMWRRKFARRKQPASHVCRLDHTQKYTYLLLGKTRLKSTNNWLKQTSKSRKTSQVKLKSQAKIEPRHCDITLGNFVGRCWPDREVRPHPSVKTLNLKFQWPQHFNCLDMTIRKSTNLFKTLNLKLQWTRAVCKEWFW